MKSQPQPVVGAFILNPQGEILLTKSHKWSNLYVVPGGHIEPGEKMEDAVIREVKEETGLEVFKPKFMCVYQYIDDGEYYKKDIHMIFLEFLTKTNGGRIKLNDEAEEYVWVKPEEALKLPLYRYTRQAIEDFIIKKK
jgi:nucleoside triphosphatase